MARSLDPPRSKMRQLAVGDRIAHWRFEDGPGATIADDGASSLTSAVTNNVIDGPFYGESSNRGRSFGTGTYATGVSTAGQRAALAGEWTIEVWARPTSLAGTNAIVAHGSNVSGENNNYLASLRLDGAAITVLWQRTASKTPVSASSGDVVVVDELQHLAARCRVTGGGATREVSLWRNGEQVAVVAGLAPPTGGATGAWEVGALPGSHGSPYDGDIYDIRVSAVALDDDAIRESWARGVRDYDHATLYASGAYEVYGRALLHDGDAAWIDLSDFWNADWIDSIEIEEGVDDQGTSATLSLRREIFDLSLLPTRTTSAPNATAPLGELLRLMGRVKIEVAVVPLGTDKDGVTLADWLPMFRGFITALDTATDPIKVELFDEVAALQDVWVEPDRAFTPPRDRVYGTDAGTAVEPELQRIVDDNVPPTVGYVGGTPSIYTPTTSAVNVRTCTTTSSKNVISSLEDVVTQWGWDLRYVWDDRRQQPRLTYAEPPRSATWTIGMPTVGADTLLSRDRLEVRRDDVRNVVEVEYGDEDTEHPGTIKRRTVVVESAASIARFGRRYCRIGLASDGQVTDLAGATALGERVVSDLAWPLADVDTLLLFRHDIVLHDVVRHIADGIHFDVAVDFATVGVRHRLAAGEARTTLVQRGTVPSGKRWKWMVLITQPLQSTTPPAAPAGVVAVGIVGGARIGWDLQPYRGSRRHRETELHWSLLNGFTPSGSTLRERGRGASSASLAGMSPGVVHYARVAHIDEMGNVSAMSPQVAVTPRQLPVTGHARVRRSANITITPTTWVTVAWNVEDADPLSRHNAGSYTALTAGLLGVDARALLDSAGKPAAPCSLAIFVNGVLREPGDVLTTNSGAAPNRAQTRVAAPIAVAVGDVVTLRAYCEGNVGTAVIADATNSRAWFTPITED